MNQLLEQADRMLKGHGFDYAFCGGYAIDLFLGYESRIHGDIDILAYWSDRDSIILYMQSLGFQIYEMLGGGKVHHITDIQIQRKEKRNIFCCKEDCEVVQIWKTEENEIYRVDFHHIGQTQLNFIEFLFNEKTDSEFLYARNHNVKRKLRDAFLSYRGMPYLAPEICLLYKSTDTEREVYQQDYYLATSRMNTEQLVWLNDAIDFLYPQGHKWKHRGGVCMFDDIELKIKKHNKILFARNSACIQELRRLICEQRHTTLVLWAFECLQIPMNELILKYPDKIEIKKAYELSNGWARGTVKMTVAKRAILKCHSLAKEFDQEYDIALCHAIGQGCSTVHVETHALGLVFYELTAIVVKNDYKEYEEEVSKKIDFYINRLVWWQDNIESIEYSQSWAGFLVKHGKMNKEKLLLEKSQD